MRRFLTKFGWHVATALVATLAAIFILIAVLAIGGIPWETARPWVLLAIGLLLALTALVVQSYAPPGPNLIERALTVDIEPILIVIGSVLTLIGTIYWFDFGSNNPQPNRWWVALIGAGLLILIVGVLRTVDPAQDIEVDSTFHRIEQAAKRAKRVGREASKAKTAAEKADPSLDDDTLAWIGLVAKRAEVNVENVMEGARRAGTLQSQLGRIALDCEHQAGTAEKYVAQIRDHKELATEAARKRKKLGVRIGEESDTTGKGEDSAATAPEKSDVDAST